MKKSVFLFIILESLSAFVLILFVNFANYNVNNLKNIPFGLSKGYIKVSARYLLPWDDKKENNQFNKFSLSIKEILGQDQCTVVLDNFESEGMGLFDTKGTYANKLDSGEYFNIDDFESGNTNILVVEDSFGHKCSKKNSGIFYANGQIFKVKGVLDKSTPLLNTDHTFIYNLLNTRNFDGNYYIDAKDSTIATNIYKLFQDFGFQTEISYPTQGKIPFLKLMTWLNTQKFITIMEFGVIVVYFNICLYFIYFLSRQTKNICIRQRLGATKYNIYLYFSKYIISSCIIGSVSAIVSYNFIFRLMNIGNRMYISTELLFKVSLFHSFLTYLIFTIIFYFKRNPNEGGGLKT